MENTSNKQRNEEPPLTPKGVFVPEQFYSMQSANDDEIDLRELWTVIWQGKWIIAGVTVLAAAIGIYISLSMPNLYKSTATLISTTSQEQSGTAALAARFGGLASMAGVNLGGSSLDKTSMAIEILKSHAFLSEFIEKRELKPILMASKSWDAEANKIVYDKNIYAQETKEWSWQTSSQWKREQEPTNQEAVKVLLNSIAISQNKESGLVNISATHLSPYIAQQWVQWLVEDINQHMRRQDIAEAEKSIGYLKAKLEQTPLAEMQKIFYELIEAQTKTKMLAEIRDQYVLKVIDPATVPELKDKPKRALICIMAVLLGGVVGVLLVFLNKALGKYKDTVTHSSSQDFLKSNV